VAETVKFILFTVIIVVSVFIAAEFAAKFGNRHR
jgi:hypothetical protein